MSNYSAGQGPYPADPHPRLGLAALTAVIAGVVLLAAAAFVLSYPGIHQLALHAGVSPGLAKLYPLIFDAMLVVAGAAALALRGAGWWARAYAWFSLLLLVTVVAVGDAVRATNVALPLQPTRAVAAVTPWVLLLLAFGLLLEMLRHLRRTRAAAAQRGNAGRAAAAGGPAAAGQVTAGGTADGSMADGSTVGGGTTAGADAAARTPVTWAGADGAGAGRSLPAPRSGLDLLLGPREIEAPAMAGAQQDAGAATAGYAGYHDGGQYPDPVAYGPETGYVHPDSYADPVRYLAGPEGTAGPAGNGDGPGPGDASGQPGSPAKAQDAAAPRKQAAPETGAKASQPGPAAAAATAPAAAPPEGPDSSPTPETPAGAAAQNGPPAAAGPAATAENPAGEAGSPGPADDTPAEKPAPAPLLERLRSTPAPPEE
jgi:hypothetical protein